MTRVPLIVIVACATLHAQEPKGPPVMPPEVVLPTAADLIARIQSNVGVPWLKTTVDTNKAGDPATPITGVATTMMATLDVLQRAAAAHQNLIITHEPTFYSHLDHTTDFETESDAVYATKAKFIADNHLVVFRFHDHWHMHRPDGILTGVIRAIGWQTYQHPDQPQLFTIPQSTLNEVATTLRDKLHATAVRVIGNANMPVTKVALSPGAGGTAGHRHLLQRDDVEVLVIGEVPEWETQEYVADAVTEGKHKALIMLGHIPSEQPGMEDCAEWVKTFVKDVPVSYVPAIEPFFLAK